MDKPHEKGDLGSGNAVPPWRGNGSSPAMAEGAALDGGTGTPRLAGLGLEKAVLGRLKACLSDPRSMILPFPQGGPVASRTPGSGRSFLIIDVERAEGLSASLLQDGLATVLARGGLKAYALVTPADSFSTSPDLQSGAHPLGLDSLRDPLTGLLNRTGLWMAFDHVKALSAVARTPLCLAFLDMNHFKSINDTYGHAVGDQVLKTFAECMQARLRISDIFSRWGGDEFVIVFVNADIKEARRVLNLGLFLFSEQRFGKSGEAPTGVECSAGLIEVSRFNSLESSIQRADEVLYRVKRGQVGGILTDEDRFSIPRQILLADDDDATALLVINFLKHEGFDVVRCRDGEEVLGMVENLRTALFIIDVMMPKVHGLRLLRSLRRIPKFSRTPVILLTARSASADVTHGFDAGADDYVSKPFSPVELMARVKRLLRMH